MCRAQRPNHTTPAEAGARSGDVTDGEWRNPVAANPVAATSSTPKSVTPAKAGVTDLGSDEEFRYFGLSNWAPAFAGVVEVAGVVTLGVVALGCATSVA